MLLGIVLRNNFHDMKLSRRIYGIFHNSKAKILVENSWNYRFSILMFASLVTGKNEWLLLNWQVHKTISAISDLSIEFLFRQFIAI